MFVPRRDPTPADISRAARAETPVVNVSDPDRWQRLLNAMRGVQTNVIGHAVFQFVCPCCHRGIGLAGQATDRHGNTEVTASCNTCGAGFDDICEKRPREPIPVVPHFVAPKPPPPNYQPPASEGPIRRFFRGGR